jgi:hypothetical protein
MIDSPISRACGGVWTPRPRGPADARRVHDLEESII